MNKIKLNDKFLFYFTENIICDKSITIKGIQVDTRDDDYHNVVSVKSILGNQDHVNYTLYNDNNHPIYESVFGSIEINRTTYLNRNDDVDFEIILMDEITHGVPIKLCKDGKLIDNPTKTAFPFVKSCYPDNSIKYDFTPDGTFVNK